MAKESERIEERDEPTRIGGIDYPDEVIRALLERRLVVFAGAGVSMDAPTSLPNFDGLVREFEASTRQARAERETIDQYLGRIQFERKVEVHARVIRLLTRNEPLPNQNHTNLLKLFGSSGAVRLVTTNFDLMFEEAAETLGWKLKSYTAPAMPRARDFKGIVHLHGSIEDEMSMVLTKGDFGGAYTQPGWAATFLADLVRGSTVLFVGYSGSDILPDYLLTNIHETSDSRLVMLRNQHDEPIDQQSGIDVVKYQSSSRDDHLTLSRSLGRLGELFYLDMSQWREAIKIAAANLGPDRESDEETMRIGLRRLETTRYFVEAVNDMPWVRWLDANGYLKSLFTADPLTQSDECLACLVAHLCIRDEPAFLLSVLERHGLRMSKCLWRHLIFAICRTEIQGVSLAQWTSIILQHPVERMEGDALYALAKACHERSDTEATLLMYQFLTRPMRVGTQSGWSRLEGNVQITEDVVDQDGGSLALHYCADTFDDQSIPILKRGLEIGIWSFRRRHELLKIWDEATDDYDPWSTEFNPFDPQFADDLPNGFDLMFVITRQQIHSLVKSDGDYADELIRRLAEASSPILRRLGVDAVEIRGDSNDETKAAWLIDNVKGGDRELVSEVSRLLERVFRSLCSETQSRLVDWLMSWEEIPGRPIKNIVCAKARWLHLLASVDPSSHAVANAIEELERIDPNAMAKRLPERAFEITETGFIDHPKPFSVEDLLSQRAADWLQDLIAWRYPGEWMWSEERRGLQQIVQQACVQEFRWGNDLAMGLIDLENLSTDLWEAVLAAWHDEGCAIDDWSSVLDVLAFVLERKDLSRGVAWVLVRFAKDAGGSELYERANRLAADMWRENSDDAEGWLGSGLLYASWNSAAGQIPMYWVEVAKRLLDRSVVSDRVETELKRAVPDILDFNSQQSTVGKVTLGAWFRVLYQLDEEWAKEELVPMFVTSQDGFEAAWEGFLWTFQGTLWMPDIMMDHVEGAIANRQQINTDEGAGIPRLVSYLCCTQEPAVSHRLFQVLCTTANDAESLGNDIAGFVIGIRSLLRRMDVQHRIRLWGSWLRDHLEHRRNGIPRGLLEGEVWELLTLIPVMLPAVPEIVDVLTDFPLDGSDTNSFDMIFHRVDVNDFPREYTKLMLYLDRYDLDDWQWNHNKKHIDKLIANEAVPLDQRRRLQDLKFKHMID